MSKNELATGQTRCAVRRGLGLTIFMAAWVAVTACAPAPVAREGAFSQPIPFEVVPPAPMPDRDQVLSHVAQSVARDGLSHDSWAQSRYPDLAASAWQQFVKSREQSVRTPDAKNLAHEVQKSFGNRLGGLVVVDSGGQQHSPAVALASFRHESKDDQAHFLLLGRVITQNMIERKGRNDKNAREFFVVMDIAIKGKWLNQAGRVAGEISDVTYKTTVRNAGKGGGDLSHVAANVSEAVLKATLAKAASSFGAGNASLASLDQRVEETIHAALRYELLDNRYGPVQTAKAERTEVLLDTDHVTAVSRLQRSPLATPLSGNGDVFSDIAYFPWNGKKLVQRHRIQLYPDKNKTVAVFSGDYEYVKDAFSGLDLNGWRDFDGHRQDLIKRVKAVVEAKKEPDPKVSFSTEATAAAGKFTFFGLPFGAPLASVESNGKFRCQPSPAAVVCKAKIADLGVKDVEYVDEIALYFHDSKFVQATVPANSMDTPERLAQKSRAMIDYLGDVFDLKKHKNEIEFSFRSMARPEINYPARRWVGVEVVFQVSDRRLSKKYEQDRDTAVAESERSRRMNAKKGMQILTP